MYSIKAQIFLFLILPFMIIGSISFVFASIYVKDGFEKNLQTSAFIDAERISDSIKEATLSKDIRTRRECTRIYIPKSKTIPHRAYFLKSSRRDRQSQRRRSYFHTGSAHHLRTISHRDDARNIRFHRDYGSIRPGFLYSLRDQYGWVTDAFSAHAPPLTHDNRPNCRTITNRGKFHTRKHGSAYAG